MEVTVAYPLVDGDLQLLRLPRAEAAGTEGHHAGLAVAECLATAGWNSLPGASSLTSRYSASPSLLSRRSSSSTAARSWELYDRNASTPPHGRHRGTLTAIRRPVEAARPPCPAYVAAWCYPDDILVNLTIQ